MSGSIYVLYANHGHYLQYIRQRTRHVAKAMGSVGYVAKCHYDPEGYKTNLHDIKIGKFLMIQKDRPKISVYIAISIDGYIARKDGNLDWLEYGHTGDEDYGFNKFIDDIDALVLGRNTYDVVSSFDKWPYEGKRVIVLSNTLNEVRKEAELFCGQLRHLTSTLYSEGIKHVWVDGGVTVSKFLEAGLVDDITISVIAVILGSGIPLFSTMDREHKCRLLSTRSYRSGLVQLKYEVTHDD